MFASLIVYLLIAMIGHAITVNENDKEWKNKEWQEDRYVRAKRMGYDVCCSSIRREKMHKKYGYKYDPLMKGQTFDITDGEYIRKKEARKNAESNN